MPLVTAAGYPYHPIADTGPSPTPGDDYQRISGATPEAFGASVGQATERLGTQFEKSGDVLAEAAIQQQRLTNQVAANQSDNYVMDRMTKLMRGDPDVPGDTGFFGKQGKDAATAYPGAVKQMDKILEDARNSLSNTRQQLLFDQNTRRMRNYWAQSLGSHYDQQLKTAAHNEAVAGGKIASQGLASAVANDDTAGESLYVERWMKSEIERVRAAGGSSTEVDLALNNIRGAYTRMKVETLANKDPLAARDYLEANKDVVLTSPNGHDAYNQLTNSIRTKADAAQVRIDNGYGSPRPGLSRLTSHMAVGGALRGRITEAVAETELDPKFVSAVADIESRGGRKLGRRGNIFQLGRDEWASVGGGRMGDPDTDIRNGVKFLVNKKSEMAMALGREPTPGEIYLAHQQGTAGAVALLSSPNTPAGQVVPPIHISGNGGNPNAPASQFIAYINHEVARRMGEPTVASADTVATSPGPTAVPVAATGGLDQLLRIPREPNELPDAEVPGLLIRLRVIDSRVPKDAPNREARLEAAVKYARRELNADYTDHQHALRMKQEQDKAIDQSIMMEYQRRMTSGNVNYPTMDEVYSDTRFKTSEAQRTMAELIGRHTQPDPAAAVSAENKRMLFDRIHARDDSPDKIRDESILDRAYIDRELTYEDHTKIIENFRAANNSTTQAIEKHKHELFTRVKAKIVPSVVLGKMIEGYTDEDGEERFALYTRMVEDKISEYRKANKNPDDLFNPTKPDYVGRKEILESPQYKPALNNRLEDVKPKNSQIRTAPTITLETATDLSDLQKLYAASPADRDKIIAEGLRRGIIRPSVPIPEAPVR